jgi:hypothetical protein
MSPVSLLHSVKDLLPIIHIIVRPWLVEARTRLPRSPVIVIMVKGSFAA